MTRVRITGGYLNVETRDGIEGPVDPGFGVGDGAGIDNGLPPVGGGIGPDNGLPRPPPGVFPPLTPSHPIQPAPGVPPGTIWPPVGGPIHPDQGLPGGGSPPAPDQGLPGGGTRPVRPDQGLPSKTFWIVAGIPGVGWRYVCVDPSLTVSHPIAPTPPTPAPKPV
jgi:hypothetical protein